MQDFLVVFESEWNNKYSYKSSIGKLGDTIKEIEEGFELNSGFDDEDYEHYNSDKPFQVGTMGLGFYDIDYVDCDEYESYQGRIMIFEI